MTLLTVLKHELKGMFFVPLGWVYLFVFILLACLLSFTTGSFYLLGEASLSYPFFRWHPLLYALLVPAVGMRTWTQEVHQGTLELLHAQPVGLGQIAIGKYLAGLLLVLLGLFLTFPMVIMVGVLGAPDYGEILSGYVGSSLVAAAFLAISCYASARSVSSVTAYLLASAVCVMLVLLGSAQIESQLPHMLPGSRTAVDLLSSLSVAPYFSSFREGVVELKALVYFAVIVVLSLWTTVRCLKGRTA